jgi:hypothetical protein
MASKPARIDLIKLGGAGKAWVSVVSIRFYQFYHKAPVETDTWRPAL